MRATAAPRVGFVSLHDPMDPAALSGMPHAMFRALRRRGLDLIDMGRLDFVPCRLGTAGRVWYGSVRRLGAWRDRLAGDEAARWMNHPETMTRRFLARCRRRARALDAAIARHRPDVLFGNCMSSPFAFLESPVPIVYSGDATAEIISATYPRYAAMGPAYAAATSLVERRALARVRFAALASPATFESAVGTYGLLPDRGRVVGFGANIGPAPGDDPAGSSAEPTREALRLTITAADPERKRVSMAIECVGILRSRGWNASLDVIGPRPNAAESAATIRWVGRLDHAKPEHVRTHARILAESHVCLLPSSGEAYGIAPIESALFGAPAVVTDVGGLPFVVRDGETGRVVPPEAGAEALADAVESIVADASGYRRMGDAARARAERELNWDAWASTVAGLIRTAAREHGAAGRRGLSGRDASGRS